MVVHGTGQSPLRLLSEAELLQLGLAKQLLGVHS